jgi:amino acid transporter
METIKKNNTRGVSMEKKIRFLHLMDNIAIVLSVAAVWTTIIMIMFKVIELSESRIFTVIASVAAFSVLIALTVTSIALIFHLKNNRQELYEEEIKNLKKCTEAA